MLNKVTKLESLGGFRLRVHFADGSVGEHDFTSLVAKPGKMSEPLRDPAFFAQVRLEYSAPTWPNGYDMCPDWLRMTLADAGELRDRVAAE